MKNLSLVLFLVFAAACAHKKVISGGATAKNDVVELNVLSVTDKGKKYDIELQITNLLDKDIIIMLNDMACKKGTAGGSLKHTFFNTGERTIDFRPNQMKPFKLVCDIQQKVPGDYKITIRRVFSNPEGDGATKGKEIAGSLEWTAKGEE